MPSKIVFLSSTAKDLSAYREAVYRAIEGLDGYHCVRMEDFGAGDQDAADKPCLMLLAPEDSSLPANLIEPDEKRRKQRAFRERPWPRPSGCWQS
jgi:hypothetical protein